MAKILIIEDEEALLSMLADKLERQGYEVLSARDGEEGLLKVRAEGPDLVLLDIIMPKVSGMEVLQVMHGDENLRNIPVIVISNSGQPVEIEKAKALGIRDYLVKAEFDPQEVIEKVIKVMGGESPAQMAEGSGSQESREPSEARVSRAPASFGPKRASKVLVVEDDQFLRDLIVKKLNDEGLETIQAIDGEEGLRLIRESKPALVLLDLILPGIDGFEVLKQAKADPDISKIPVVILSNLGQRDDIDRGLKLGAADYLIKAHFTPGEIVEKVKEILGK